MSLSSTCFLIRKQAAVQNTDNLVLWKLLPNEDKLLLPLSLRDSHAGVVQTIRLKAFAATCSTRSTCGMDR